MGWTDRGTWVCGRGDTSLNHISTTSASGPALSRHRPAYPHSRVIRQLTYPPFSAVMSIGGAFLTKTSGSIKPKMPENGPYGSAVRPPSLWVPEKVIGAE